MRRLAFSILLLSASCQNSPSDLPELVTPFEKSVEKATATYAEGIAWWKQLEESSPFVCVQTVGETDAGHPLHVVVINSSRVFAADKVLRSGKARLLINNAIHPGEPDGVDASMLFARELVSQPDFEEAFDSLVIVIIPFYNVGGALNRGCCSRANQTGPDDYGFRGSARNLDLNRDFIKCDSRNALTFARLFQQWQPQLYLETHVSNGADYPYTMTLLTTHPDKLAEPLSQLLSSELEPTLYKEMADQQDVMVPYVNVFGTPPDSGYSAFYDTPRYSTGFTTLHHCIGLLAETHMLKPYGQRVHSTKRLIEASAIWAANNHRKLLASQQKAIAWTAQQSELTIDWDLDSATIPLAFNGYTAFWDTSSVTGLPLLRYDRNRPWKANIRYQNRLKPTAQAVVPKAYLVPYAWREVVERLEANGVKMRLLERDTTIEAEQNKIVNFNTENKPYEGHYLHSNTQTASVLKSIVLPARSYYWVSTSQPARRFLVETLEANAPDSYFNWNFFDEVLQQKEWYSDYVFEPVAAAMLEASDTLAASFAKAKTDSAFASSSHRQLTFLYRRSPHYERMRHSQYPVLRLP